MIGRVRALWRRARSVPVLRWLLLRGDRLWWAHVITRAHVADPRFLAAQGFRSTRAAVRAYVRGGFREAVALNPLFMERLVAGQLSDVGRVPALYAYLVNDSQQLEVSVNWNAPEYARTRPAAVPGDGGVLGTAWRTAVERGAFVLGDAVDTVTVSWSDIALAAGAAARRATGRQAPEPLPMITEPIVLICRIAAGEPDAAEAMRRAIDFRRSRSAAVVFAIEGASVDHWVSAALITLWLPDAYVAADHAGLLDEVSVAAPRSVLVVRGPESEITSADLGALADAASDRLVMPLWLDSHDGTIASAGAVVHGGRTYPLLVGHPPEDAQALGGALESAPSPITTFARPAQTAGAIHEPLVLLGTTVRSPSDSGWAPAATGHTADTDVDRILAPAGLGVASWSVDGPTLMRRGRTSVVLADGRRVPRLRWAIKTAAPAGPRGEWWGDTHYARGIADALRRLGQEVVIDSYAARSRSSASLDDVVLALRGPEPIRPQRGATSILWIISHPDEIGAADLDGFDVVYAASEPWARVASTRFGRDVIPLLQCTDPNRFRPRGLPRTDELIFIGTARGIPRPSIIEPIRAGIPVSVYGPDWSGWIPGAAIRGRGVPNASLPPMYEGAGAVLNDHWPAMRDAGFVSNRLFDVVAAGGRAISDHVEGIDEIFDGAVRTYRDIPDLIEILSGELDALFPDERSLSDVAARVRELHSYDARARLILDTVLDR